MATEARKENKRRSAWASFCRVLGTLILLAVILSSLPLTLPRLLGMEVYSVLSGSMEPEIPVGSVVYTAPVEPEEVEAGDVIAFDSGGSIVVHRVKENRFVVGEFVTKGDANAIDDFRTVPYGALLGRVERHFPLVGRLLFIYASPVGKAYVLCFAGCGGLLLLLGAQLSAGKKNQQG